MLICFAPKFLYKLYSQHGLSGIVGVWQQSKATLLLHKARQTLDKWISLKRKCEWIVSRILAGLFCCNSCCALNMATNFSFPNLEFFQYNLTVTFSSHCFSFSLSTASEFQCHFSKELRICCVNFLPYFFVLCDFVKHKSVEFSSLSHLSFACSFHFHSFSFTNLVAKVFCFEWKFSNKILICCFGTCRQCLQNFQVRDWFTQNKFISHL